VKLRVRGTSTTVISCQRQTTLHFPFLSNNKYIMHLKSSTCSGHLPIQVQALGYCNTQSLTTSMALMTMKIAKCSLFLQHKYVVYSQFKSSSDMQWLVGPAIVALLYRLSMNLYFPQSHVNKYMHIVQTELILMVFFYITQYYCA